MYMDSVKNDELEKFRRDFSRCANPDVTPLFNIADSFSIESSGFCFFLSRIAKKMTNRLFLTYHYRKVLSFSTADILEAQKG